MTHLKEIGKNSLFLGTERTEREDSKFRHHCIMTLMSYHSL